MNRGVVRVLILYRSCDRVGLIRIVSKEKLVPGVGTVLSGVSECWNRSDCHFYLKQTSTDTKKN